MRYLSLFSGIESATLAWHGLGWTPVAFSEIEPFCNALLSHHYPDVPNLGNIDGITETTIQSLGPIDLVVFGSPCQDLSVAGKRSGLSGNRSGLFTRAIDIINWARKHNGLKYAVWENVPGVFSSHQGKDFSEVLRLLTGYGHTLREGQKWQTSGIALGSESLCEWRTLDAQYFGIPQRRRRVFAFVDFTETERTEPVLFEPEGLRGNPEKGREKKQDLAGTLEARLTAGGFPGTDGACANHIVVNPPCFWDGSQTSQCLDAVIAKQQCMPEKNRFPAILEPVPIHDQATRSVGKRADKQDGKGNGLGIGKPGDPMNTLTSGDHHAVCYCGTQNDALRDLADNQCPTLRAGSNGGVVNPMITYEVWGGSKRKDRPEGGFYVNETETSKPLDCTKGLDPSCSQGGMAIQSNHSIVRRLTPVECERLQGIPDNWTQIPYRKKPADQCPDTPRYRAIGNAMAVPVMRWIGERIEKICNTTNTSISIPVSTVSNDL